MRVPLYLAMIAVLAGCAPAGRTAPAAMRADPDEAAVWATLIDSVFAADGAPFVVVADSTWHMIITVEDIRVAAHRLDPGFPESAVDDYGARNRTHLSIPRRLPAGTPNRRLRLQTFAPDGDPVAAHERFRRENAPVVGYHYFSRPGFDVARRHAVITTAWCVSYCASGKLFLLARGAHGWRVVRREDTWVT
jgi:hypothetical protein